MDVTNISDIPTMHLEVDYVVVHPQSTCR